MENDINDREPHIVTTLETENTLTDDSLLASTPETEKLQLKIHYQENGPGRIFQLKTRKN